MITVYTQCLNCGKVREHSDFDTPEGKLGKATEKTAVPKDAKVYSACCVKCISNTTRIPDGDLIVNQCPTLERKPTITVEEFDKVVAECMDLPYEQMRPKIAEAIALIGMDHSKSVPFKKFMALRRDEILARIDEVQVTAK